MPIHLASNYLSGLFALDTFPTVLACIVAVIFLKQWSAGIDLVARLDREADKAEKEPDIGKARQMVARDLHGTVILVVGGFTAQGLLVCSQLSALGAQLILLTPTLRSTYVMQMIHLLRDGTSNPLIYAEECDITELASVEAFAAQWNLGEGTGGHSGGVGAGPAGGLSASTGMGAASSAGAKEGKEGKGVAPRRVDAVIFLPLDSSRYAVGSPARFTAEDVECSHAEVLGRFHLVNILLPSLLLLPPNRDIRIVSLLSPWYAASVPKFDVQKTEVHSQSLRRREEFTSPWANDGAQSLLWLALSRELQRRIQLMTDVDQRPRTKLPGIDDDGNMIGKATPTNVNLINVCAGFERGRDVLDYLLPGTGQAKELREDWDDAEEVLSKARVNRKSEPALSDELKGLLDPRLKSTRSEKKSTKPAKLADDVTARLDKQLKDSSAPSTLAKVWNVLRYALVTLLWPLAWLLCKSPRRAAEAVTWATVAPIFNAKAFDPAMGAKAVMPGELHREGRIVRPALPDALLPGPSIETVWRTMEDRAKRALASAQQ